MAATFKTKGIVLRAIPYGETSLIVSIFTELFGIQSYLVNGVRKTAKKSGAGKAMYFQVGALLDLIVYHQENKQLHRIKEMEWAYIYAGIHQQVTKNLIALLMMEWLHQSLREANEQPEIFAFTYDMLLTVDQAQGALLANLPIYFTLQLAGLLGFRIESPLSHEEIFDLSEGVFLSDVPAHQYYLSGAAAKALAKILTIDEPNQLAGIAMTVAERRSLLVHLETFFRLHLPDFRSLKCLPVLFDISQ